MYPKRDSYEQTELNNIASKTDIGISYVDLKKLFESSDTDQTDRPVDKVPNTKSISRDETFSYFKARGIGMPKSKDSSSSDKSDYSESNNDTESCELTYSPMSATFETTDMDVSSCSWQVCQSEAGCMKNKPLLQETYSGDINTESSALESKNSSKSEPNHFADLRPKLSLSNIQVASKKQINNRDKECSIFEIVDLDDCWSAWSYDDNCNKPCLIESLQNRLQERKNLNICVRFGKIQFLCHKFVLRSALLFRKWTRKTYAFDVEHGVTPTAFAIFYHFALGKCPEISAKNFIDVFNAAKILQAHEMEVHCQRLLDSTLYEENAAFEIYQAAVRRKSFVIKQLMRQRVWKYFLTLVASTDFISMCVDDVCEFLQADNIGVNSELEVFFAAILWLNSNWDERKQCEILRVMSCVRFGLMPAWFTYMLRQRTGVPEVDQVVGNKDVVNMIEDGSSIAATISLYFLDSMKFKPLLKRVRVKIPKERHWIYDKNCTYHYGAHEKVSEAISYKVFKDYLKFINMEGPNYWKCFSEAEQEHLMFIFCQQYSETAWLKVQNQN